MKRFLLYLLIVVLVAIVALVLSRGWIERAVARQIEAVASDQLNGTITIGELRYRFPLTADFSDIRLEQDGVTLLSVPEGSISIASIPLGTKQVKFSGFVLERPTFRFEVDEHGTLVGWSDLIKKNDSPEDSQEVSQESNTSVSDAFAVRHIALTDGLFVYADARSNEPPMELDSVTLSIAAHKAIANQLDRDGKELPSGAGWYHLQTTLEREQLFTLKVDCGLDINTGSSAYKNVELTTQLNSENQTVLPPQVRAFLRKHAITGALNATLYGRVPVEDPLEGPLHLDATLSNGTFDGDGVTIDIKTTKATVTLKDGVLLLEPFTAELLGGSLAGDAELRLRPTPGAENDDLVPPNVALGLSCGVQLTDIRLEELTANREEADRLVGQLDLDVEAMGDASKFPETLSGDGVLEFSKGRIGSLDIVSALGRAMRSVFQDPEDDDRGTMRFTLRPDGVVVNEFQLIAGLMAARGRGIIRFNDTIEFIVNGGPLERAQAELGVLGDAFGAITDRILRYQVAGSLDDPKVTVHPLGIGTVDPTAAP